jgi:signal transduction histidine kinase
MVETSDEAPLLERLWALVDAGILLSQELDLDAILRTIVSTACSVIGSRYGALGVINENGTGLSSFVYTGITQAERDVIGDLPRGRGLLGALIADPRPLRLEDLSTDARSVGFPEGHPAMNSFLGVPVASKGRVFGNLYLTEKLNGEPFTEADQRLAIALAAQAAVALENARLYAEAHRAEGGARRRLRELELVQEVGSAMLGEFEVTRVLRTIALRARELVAADASAIALYDEERDHFVIRVAVGRNASTLEGTEIAAEGTLTSLVSSSGHPLLVSDTEEIEDITVTMAELTGSRSMILAPVARSPERMGVLMVSAADVARFDDDDLFVVQRFADLGSLALRNARSISLELEQARLASELERAQERDEMRSQTLHAVIRAQEDERLRISRELHDSFGQMLASMLLALKLVDQETSMDEVHRRLVEAREITAAAAAEVKRISLELRPASLDDYGLPAALRRLAGDWQDRSGIPVDMTITVEERPAPVVETVVYRIAQEALNNALKHANASSISLSLTEVWGQLHLVVKDDGRGFDPELVEGRGLGIVGMRERAHLVGGRLDLTSGLGAGTIVELVVPKDAN